ncbi:hypothetical protein PPERSA_00214 [Pseudocohnilembus persalinus]|uniref:Uncharacterized protein n=1 Tax=Pseudocohnilembus persalinus TaxID=266149 RepID=A0A0V0QQJ7_PSEPJ|nr:hypothetical protein PPERSA_00214 [Pseudocohnilembus persalinus]|eukprot:KRX04445.1 hypothetical protein PPERSA_00214 [Pseudocohnilembus persalinus]
MSLSQQQTENYLKRINTEKKQPSVQYLFEIVKNQQIFIPFENLQVYFKKSINLDIQALYDKIVQNKQGGVCYELHVHLVAHLKNLGFQAYLVKGNVADFVNGGFDENNMHNIIIVDFNNDEKYMVDVGFGDFYTKPILLKGNQIELEDFGGKYMLKLIEFQNVKQYGVYALKNNKTQELFCVDFQREQKPDLFLEGFKQNVSNPKWIFINQLIILKHYYKEVNGVQ